MTTCIKISLAFLSLISKSEMNSSFPNNLISNDQLGNIEHSETMFIGSLFSVFCSDNLRLKFPLSFINRFLLIFCFAMLLLGFLIGGVKWYKIKLITLHPWISFIDSFLVIRYFFPWSGVLFFLHYNWLTIYI